MDSEQSRQLNVGTEQELKHSGTVLHGTMESCCLAFLADTHHSRESSRLCKASVVWERGCRKRVISKLTKFILWLWVMPRKNKRKYGGRMVWLSRRWTLHLNFSSQCLFQVWLKLFVVVVAVFPWVSAVYHHVYLSFQKFLSGHINCFPILAT